jgi:hypothetical protein
VMTTSVMTISAMTTLVMTDRVVLPHCCISDDHNSESSVMTTSVKTTSVPTDRVVLLHPVAPPLAAGSPALLPGLRLPAPALVFLRRAGSQAVGGAPREPAFWV